MKKTILIVLYLLLSLIMPGCATTGYDEVEAEAVITGDTTKLDRLDRTAERATEYYRRRTKCIKSGDMTWMCRGSETRLTKRGNIEGETIDGLLRRYRHDRFASCGCVNTRDLEESMRRIGF